MRLFFSYKTLLTKGLSEVSVRWESLSRKIIFPRMQMSDSRGVFQKILSFKLLDNEITISQKGNTTCHWVNRRFQGRKLTISSKQTVDLLSTKSSTSRCEVVDFGVWNRRFASPVLLKRNLTIRLLSSRHCTKGITKGLKTQQVHCQVFRIHFNTPSSIFTLF